MQRKYFVYGLGAMAHTPLIYWALDLGNRQMNQDNEGSRITGVLMYGLAALLTIHAIAMPFIIEKRKRNLEETLNNN